MRRARLLIQSHKRVAKIELNQRIKTPESMQSVIQNVLIIVHFYYFSRNKSRMKVKDVQHCLFNPFLLFILYHMDLFFVLFGVRFSVSKHYSSPLRFEINSTFNRWFVGGHRLLCDFLATYKTCCQRGCGRAHRTKELYREAVRTNAPTQPWGSGMEIDVRAKPTS